MRAHRLVVTLAIVAAASLGATRLSQGASAAALPASSPAVRPLPESGGYAGSETDLRIAEPEPAAELASDVAADVAPEPAEEPPPQPAPTAAPIVSPRPVALPVRTPVPTVAPTPTTCPSTWFCYPRLGLAGPIVPYTDCSGSTDVGAAIRSYTCLSDTYLMGHAYTQFGLVRQWVAGDIVFAWGKRFTVYGALTEQACAAPTFPLAPLSLQTSLTSNSCGPVLVVQAR